MIDVVVVGGGPAGLHSASLLAESGLDVLVLEDHREIGRPAHCTGIASAEITEFVKVPEDAILGGVTRAWLVGPSGVHADVGWNGARREPILVLDRAVFDRSLAEQALRAGATVRTGSKVDDVAIGDDRVVVRVAAEHVEARACLLACGVSYGFQRRLGLGLPGCVIHTAQTEVDAAPADGVELYFGRTVAPEGFVWTVPVRRGGRSRLKIGTIARGHAAASLQRFMRRPEVARRLSGDPDTLIQRLLPLRPLPKTYTDRLLAIGDAGGFTKPATGGGIFYSLLTASLATQTLIDAFRTGRFDETFLAVYATRWQERLRHEVCVADWLRGRLIHLKDAEIDALVAALGTDDVQAAIQRTARFNWHRDMIVALLRQPGIGALLVRSFFRSAAARC